MGKLRFEPKDRLVFRSLSFQWEPESTDKPEVPPISIYFGTYRIEIPNDFDQNTLRYVRAVLRGQAC